MGEVVQAEAAEAAEGADAADADERGGPLALLEAIDRDGQVRQAWRVERWPLSIGRAIDNDVVLSDPHVAAHHAMIAVADGVVFVRAGATLNGIGIGHERIGGGQTHELAGAAGDLDLHIGRATLRLRLAGRELAAEQAMAPLVLHERRWLPTALLALAVLAVVLANAWIDSDPEGLARAIGTAVTSALLGAGLWCGLWALLSKTFTRQSHLDWHVRVFVLASLASLALGVLPALAAFAFSWPWLTDFSFIALYAVVASAIYFHLLAVEPARRRLMRAVAASGFVAAVALSLWFNVQRTGRPGEELYMNHLFAPQLRVARPVPVNGFVDALAPMQAILDRKAKEQAGTDSDSRTGDDDEE